MPTMLAELSSKPYSFHNHVELGCATLGGVGLISGQHVEVRLKQGVAGQGSCFVFADGERLPIDATHVLNSARGVTLCTPLGKSLSIVEHYLAALSLSGLNDIECHIQAGHHELPLLDGSSLPWWKALQQAFVLPEQRYRKRITRPFFFRTPGQQATLYATPAPTLELSYTLHYSHQALKYTWATWCLPSGNQDEKHRAIQHLLQCRTFGEVRELPALQASGLAKGVTLENTLGLLEDNVGFTTALRCDNEPHHHKMLDFVGDAYLSGLRLNEIQGKFTLLYAGHTSHLAFCKALLNTPGVLIDM